MKFCPFCGASLADSAAFFCAECGEPLPRSVKPDNVKHETDTELSTGDPKRAKRPPRPVRKNSAVKRLPGRKKKRPVTAAAPASELCDDSYDGYYNDIKPIDDNQVHEKIDHGMIKQIIIFAAGAIVIIILAVIAMYLL